MGKQSDNTHQKHVAKAKKSSKAKGVKGLDQQKRAVKAVQAAIVQANHVVRVGLNPSENMNILEQVKLMHPSNEDITKEEKKADFHYIERLAHSPAPKASLGDKIVNSLKKIAGWKTAPESEEFNPQWATTLHGNNEDGWAEE